LHVFPRFPSFARVPALVFPRFASFARVPTLAPVAEKKLTNYGWRLRNITRLVMKVVFLQNKTKQNKNTHTTTSEPHKVD